MGPVPRELGLLFADKISPGYVTTATGAISEFIAAVFFYLYNKTIISMGGYHQKLVITQNIALAMKITTELPENNRADAQLILIEALTRNVNQYLAGSLICTDKPKTPVKKDTRKTPAPA